MTTRLCDLLGIERPIIQAPMAGSQDAELALAVTATGALGSLPCATLDAKTLESEVTTLQAAAGPINLNFFCHPAADADPERDRAWRELLAPYYLEWGIDASSLPSGPARRPFDAEAAQLLEAHEPGIVSFHFGLPEPKLLARIKRLGTIILASATTVAEARWLEQRGADVVIAQGLEAGGHRGMFLSADLTTQSPTFALLREIVAAVSLPVVAAGGISNDTAVAAAKSLGASGVQVGSAYLLCPEARTTPVHRAALQGPDAAFTALTRLFSGRPARGIVNRLMRELGPMHPGAPAFPLATAALAPLRQAAESEGLPDFSPLWCGQHPPRQVLPAAELTHLLAGGWFSN